MKTKELRKSLEKEMIVLLPDYDWQIISDKLDQAIAEERERVRRVIEKNDLGLYSGDVKSIVDLLSSLDELEVEKEI